MEALLITDKLKVYCALLALPLLICVLWIFGPAQTDGFRIYSGFAVGMKHHPAGAPTLDPNDGITSLALGKRAARDVLAGHLPLWNHYEGLGSPLLGEMQAAPLFPPTWLLALRSGQPIEFAVLQVIAGIGAYLFFRTFGLGNTAALACGLMYELNGVMAWLRNAITNPVAFLPWLLLFIEFARAAALADEKWGRRLFNVAWGALVATLAVYAGFPEEVYLYSLLVGAWLLMRALDLSRQQLTRFASDIGMMALVALALCAPALIAFWDFLQEAELFRHAGEGFFGVTLSPSGLIQLVLPYIYGPPFGSHSPIIQGGMWGSTGGYIGFMPVALALGALMIPGSRRAKILLVAWIIVAVGTSYGLPGVYGAFMTIPLTKTAAVFRYLNISWIFCFVFLAGMFLDALPRLQPAIARRALMTVGVGGLCILILIAWPARELLATITALERPFWLAGTLAAAGALMVVVFCAAWIAPIRAAQLIACLTVIEGAIYFVTPYAFYPRGGRVDYETIAFLKSNIGFQRVAGTPDARIGPNFGSYLGIPTLDFDDLPVPRRTVDFIRDRLDPYAFRPFPSPPLTPDEEADRRHQYELRLEEYGRAGVKYILGGPGFTAAGATPVYRGETFTVHALSHVRDYASADGCEVTPITYDRLEAECTAPSQLVRLELYMRGWSATINGVSVPVTLSENTFQSIDLPLGRSLIKFTFRPPGFEAARLLAIVALIFVSFIFIYELIKRRPAALLARLSRTGL
jgi:hypothetical protein